MYKSVIIIAISIALVATCCASPLREESDVKEGMKSAFARGRDFFGRAIEKEAEEFKPPVFTRKPFSLYTAGIESLGGGKPALVEQYTQHKFVPLAPTTNPAEHKISDPIKPNEAAKLYVPQRPLQETIDRVFVP